MKAYCHCGSGRSYFACCKRYIAGRLQAPTAESLMRSRYTANVIQDARYLFKTWHPSTRPALSELKNAEERHWLGLEIVQANHSQTDSVEFIATFEYRGQLRNLHETSRFIKENKRWFYLNGEIHPSL